MTDPWPLAIIAILLPCITGSAWAYWLLTRGDHWHPAAIIGHGYLLGLFATTMIMRGFHWAGLQQSFLGTSLCLILLALVAFGLLYLKPATSRFKPTEPVLPGWQRAVISLLLALIALRYATIFQELLLRPLFPWDAWMNWAPKAIVWYHYGELVPFRSQAEWLASPAEALVHLEGARNAWKYPLAVPLVQLWGMLAADSAQSTLPYLPWGVIPLCLIAILYGHLRLQGVSCLGACLAAYAVGNLPFINVHSALAGYADLWVATYFSAAVLLLHERFICGQRGYLVVALMFACMCTMLKVPGVVLAFIWTFSLIVGLLNMQSSRVLVVYCLAAVMCFSIMILGINISVGDANSITLSRELIELPYIGRFPLQFTNVTGAVVDTNLAMINWNLLGYLVVSGTFAYLLQRPKPHVSTVVFTAALSTVIFVAFVYYFTERYRFALDYTQINRAMMYAVPLTIYLLFSMMASSPVSISSPWQRGRRPH